MNNFPAIRSSIISSLAAIITWGIVAILQANGWMPLFNNAAPIITHAMQIAGIIPPGNYVGEPGVDPIAGLILIGTKVIVGKLLLRYWPSKAEVVSMKATVAENPQKAVASGS